MIFPSLKIPPVYLKSDTEHTQNPWMPLTCLTQTFTPSPFLFLDNVTLNALICDMTERQILYYKLLLTKLLIIESSTYHTLQRWAISAGSFLENEFPDC